MMHPGILAALLLVIAASYIYIVGIFIPSDWFQRLLPNPLRERGFGVTFILVTSMWVWLGSMLALIGVLFNDRRRKGRNEVRALMKRRRLLGARLAERVLSNGITDAFRTGNLKVLEEADVYALVLDHHLDYQFTPKIYLRLEADLKEIELQNITRNCEPILRTVDAWRNHAKSIDEKIREQINVADDAESGKKSSKLDSKGMRRAANFLRRRPNHLMVIVDDFVVDTKDAIIAAVAGRLR